MKQKQLKKTEITGEALIIQETETIKEIKTT
jgi:hypothetical protein